jgi:putative transcriptional regulator
MRKTIIKAIFESVQDLIGTGLGTSFTERELQELGVKIPEVRINPDKIKFTAHNTQMDAAVAKPPLACGT